MNYIKNIHNDMMCNYYNNIYNSFLLDQNNSNIMIINQNYFNPLSYFSHNIKKNNINLYILYNNLNSINKLDNEIKYEECNKLIHYHNYSLEQMIENYSKVSFSKIIALHLKSLDYIKSIIMLGEIFECNIYFYLSLSNKKKVYFKNKFRSIFKSDTNEIGNVFDYDQIFSYLNTLISYDIDTIKIINNNHYISYGSQKTYLFILKYKSI